MSIAKKLKELVISGVHRIGELEIQTNDSSNGFILSHHEDVEQSRQPGFGGLEIHMGPHGARDISTHSEDGTYRFSKAQLNLKKGWVLSVESEEELRLALDHFYPAGVGLYLARRQGQLDTVNLREKLNRQTGMYRFARNISDAGAQRLIRETCGPAHQCAKRILWEIAPETPLENSEASRYNGIPGEIPEQEAIPLLCREACNHFVAECRRVSKEEAAANRSEPT